MHKVPTYGLLFVAVVLAQALLFNNLNLGVWVNPLVYIAFIVLLPVETRAVWVLLLGLALGVAVDLAVGTAGLNTIATLFTAFLRRPAMMLMLGRETVVAGGTPSSARVGNGKYIRYSTAMALIQCTVFFMFEAFGFELFHLTVLKILLSTVVTTALVYFLQLLFRK